jgi:hypothetical protein
MRGIPAPSRAEHHNALDVGECHRDIANVGGLSGQELPQCVVPRHNPILPDHG